MIQLCAVITPENINRGYNNSCHALIIHNLGQMNCTEQWNVIVRCSNTDPVWHMEYFILLLGSCSYHEHILLYIMGSVNSMSVKCNNTNCLVVECSSHTRKADIHPCDSHHPAMQLSQSQAKKLGQGITMINLWVWVTPGIFPGIFLTDTTYCALGMYQTSVEVG